MSLGSPEKFIPINDQEPNVTTAAFNDALSQLTKESDGHRKALADQQKKLTLIITAITAVLIVCFLAYVTFLIDAWRFHTSEYARFVDILNQEKNQKNILKDQVQKLELKVQKIELEHDNQFIHARKL